MNLWIPAGRNPSSYDTPRGQTCLEQSSWLRCEGLNDESWPRTDASSDSVSSGLAVQSYLYINDCSALIRFLGQVVSIPEPPMKRSRITEKQKIAVDRSA